MTMDAKRTAVVITVGDRFFVKFGRGERLLTAWSLAGATLFLPNTPADNRTDAIMLRLHNKGYRAVLQQVELKGV